MSETASVKYKTKRSTFNFVLKKINKDEMHSTLALEAFSLPS